MNVYLKSSMFCTRICRYGLIEIVEENSAFALFSELFGFGSCIIYRIVFSIFLNIYFTIAKNLNSAEKVRLL